MMRRHLSRPAPRLPITSMRTFALSTPVASHFRPATCAEVECAHWRDGWRMVLDPSTDLGRRQLQFIHWRAGRAYTDVSSPGDALVTLIFKPGQRCFAEHHVPIAEKTPLLVVRDGDWRGNPTGARRRHTRVADWLDEFATHQDRLSEQRKMG
jgi:hypothetical protein